jgi:hypothetical protein
MNPPRYHLELEPVNSSRWSAPAERRLARLLKAMLRGYGWRCVRCQPTDTSAPQPTATKERPA